MNDFLSSPSSGPSRSDGTPSLSEMAAAMEALQLRSDRLQLRSEHLEQELASVRAAQRKSSIRADSGLPLVPTHSSFQYDPPQSWLLALRDSYQGIDVPFCLNPSSASLRQWYFDNTHSMAGMDYSVPQLPDGVTLNGEFKTFDSSLKDLQSRLIQVAKWIDYFAVVELTKHEGSMVDDQTDRVLGYSVSTRKLVGDICSHVSQLRLDNCFRSAGKQTISLPVSSATAPKLAACEDVAKLLASREAAKLVWDKKPTETKSSNRKGSSKKNPAKHSTGSHSSRETRSSYSRRDESPTYSKSDDKRKPRSRSRSSKDFRRSPSQKTRNV
ncbi:hypothetical protein EDD11_009972 [Mortierella claussenii]|nr:hypothetical protein EDD11_009972 [Mortierella claussenii]